MYIKIFDEYEYKDESYSEIDEDDFFIQTGAVEDQDGYLWHKKGIDERWVDFTVDEHNTIKNLFKNYHIFNYDYSRDINNKRYSKGFIIVTNNLNFRPTYSWSGTFAYFIKTTDDWYYMFDFNSVDPYNRDEECRTFKCDQFYGLMQCIKDKMLK